MVLSFSGDVEVNYESHNDVVLLNVLYSSIVKCIKSKAEYIEKLGIKYENNETKFHLFDSKFCAELMEISYTNIMHFSLVLPECNLVIIT